MKKLLLALLCLSISLQGQEPHSIDWEPFNFQSQVVPEDGINYFEYSTEEYDIEKIKELIKNTDINSPSLRTSKFSNTNPSITIDCGKFVEYDVKLDIIMRKSVEKNKILEDIKYILNEIYWWVRFIGILFFIVSILSVLGSTF